MADKVTVKLSQMAEQNPWHGDCQAVINQLEARIEAALDEKMVERMSPEQKKELASFFRTYADGLEPPGGEFKNTFGPHD